MMVARHARRVLGTATLAIALGIGSAAPAWADGADSDESVAQSSGSGDLATPADVELDRKPSGGIEQITVTARKRDENLQDTPISITAFSSVDLQDAGIRRSEDIGRFTPNLQFEQAPAVQNSASVSIRGVGNADGITTRDSGVGIYIDGVYLARAQGQLIGLSDIERVEVLRGPQGTLFGRNTVGGAVNVITKKPSLDEFESTASVRIGNYNLFETRASLNIPLVPEMAAARISLQTTSRDGYTKNLFNGQRTDDRRLLGFRAQLLANPTDDLEIVITGDQTRSHQAGRGGECRFNDAVKNQAQFVLAQENSGVDFSGACKANQGDGEEFEYTSPFRSKENLDTYGLTSIITWDVGDVTVKSTSSWQRQENEARFELTFTNIGTLGPAPLVPATGVVDGEPDHNDQASQEFNITGTALGGRLQYTGGVYGFYEKTTPAFAIAAASYNLCQIGSRNSADLVLDPFFEALLVQNVIGVPSAPGALQTFDGLGLGAVKTAVFCGGTNTTRGPKIKTNALSGYGQFTYDVTDRLHFTGGLRYSAEAKEFSFRQNNLTTEDLASAMDAFAMIPPVQGRTERFGKWTPLLNLSYDLTDEANLYATYSKGFKSGGFNGRPNANVPASLLPFEQEVLDSYEIGLKSSWFDNRLIANFALFYNEYDDIQTTILSAADNGAFASRVENASEAEIRGAEVELRAVPISGLDLRLGLGFTDAEYREFDDQVRGTIDFIPGTNTLVQNFIQVDRSNEEFFNTPRFSATFSAAYTFFDVLGLGDLTTRLNWYHQDEVNYGPQSDTLKQDTYGLLSGQILLALPDGKTELALFGENLLDRRYIGSGVSFEDGFALSDAYYGPPRMYGIEIRRSF